MFAEEKLGEEQARKLTDYIDDFAITLVNVEDTPSVIVFYNENDNTYAARLEWYAYFGDAEQDTINRIDTKFYNIPDEYDTKQYNEKAKKLWQSNEWQFDGLEIVTADTYYQYSRIIILKLQRIDNKFKQVQTLLDEIAAGLLTENEASDRVINNASIRALQNKAEQIVAELEKLLN